MKIFRAVVAFAFAYVAALADVPWVPATQSLPPGGWIPGTTVGVQGGIPARPTGSGVVLDITQPPYNADPTGVADSYAAVQQAYIDAATTAPGSVVYAPAGRYRLNSAVSFRNGAAGYAPWNNVSIRGAGTGETNTTFVGYGAACFVAEIDPAWGSSATSAIDVSTLTRGATTITVGDGTNFQVGRAIKISLRNVSSTDIMTFKVYDDTQYVRFFTTRVTAKSGNVLTVDPAIHADFTNVPNAFAYGSSFDMQEGLGLEDFKIEGYEDYAGHTNMTDGIKFGPLLINSWIRNVVVSKHDNHGIKFFEPIYCEIKTSGVDANINPAALSNHGGLLIDGGNALLVHDSFFVKNAPNIEANFGTVRSAFLSLYVDMGVSGQNILDNHGPWNSHNLWADSYFASVNPDGYFGGISDETFYRNMVSGDSGNGGTSPQIFAFAINRFSERFSLVGNIVFNGAYDYTGVADKGFALGYPYGGFSNGNTVNRSLGTNWPDYDPTTGNAKVWLMELTTRTDDNHGIATIINTADAAAFESRLADSDGGGYPRMRGGFGMGFLKFGARSGNTWAVDSSSSVGASGAALPAVNSQSNVTAGPGGFREIDGNVARTSTLLYNYTYTTFSIPSEQAMPAGFYLGESLAGYSSASPPDYYTSAGLPYPPYDPANPAGASRSSVPAGERYLRAVPPAVVSATINPTGTQVTIGISKVVSPAGGTGGFTTTAPGASLVFNSVVGSTIVFDVSGSAITAGLSVDVTYTAASGRWEDSNGNDLASRSAFRAINLSTNTGSKRLVWSFDPNAADSTFDVPGPYNSRLFKISNPYRGIVDRIAIPIVTNTLGSTLKIGVWNSAGDIVSSGTRAVGPGGETQYFDPTAFSVTPGDYWVGFQSSDNNAPKISTRATFVPSDITKYLDPDVPYSSFPPSTISPTGNFYYDILGAFQVIPNTELNATNLTVGSFRKI